MLSYHSSYEHHVLYHMIRDFAQQYPFVHWLCVGLVTIMLLSLLFLGAFDQDRKRGVSPYTYIFFVLGTVAILDVLTQTIPMLGIYLLALGVVLYQTKSEFNHAVTFLFSTTFLTLESFTYWNKYMLLEMVGEVILFIGVAWLLLQLQFIKQETQKIKNKNSELVYKIQQKDQKLKEYNHKLEELHRRDYLTGLYNFGGFKEQVIHQLVRLQPEQSYHVVCLDLTDFKQVNMEGGLEVGDQILLLLAKQLQKDLPHFAQIARYDGDQFAIGIVGDRNVLKLCLVTVEEVMEEIKRNRRTVHYCLGTATYPQEAKSANELIRLAEKRLSIKRRQLRDQEEEHRQRLEKLSAIGQLAAGLAHEIRNPLTSIRGFVQISASENQEIKKWESIILPEIDRINDLLKQFLNLSETKPTKYTKFRLDELMNNVLSLLKPKSFLMGHELVIRESNHSIVIEADAEQIKQVMINLIQNALESLDEKGKVEVRWRQHQNQVNIQIKDNGRGINPEHYNKIFEPFFTTKNDGTGMGLSVCHRIIDEHGGDIRVDSQPGCGTTFDIYLPISQSQRKNKKTSPSEEDLLEALKEEKDEKTYMSHYIEPSRKKTIS